MFDAILFPTDGSDGADAALEFVLDVAAARDATLHVVSVADTSRSAVEQQEDVVGVLERNAERVVDAAARRARDRGVGVADAAGAALHLLSVVDVTSLGADVRSDLAVETPKERANDVLDDAAATATDAGVEPSAREVAFGSSTRGAILDYVEANDVDLVVVGTHGRSGVHRYVLGSVAESLVRTSPVPVLTVREPAD